VKNRNRSDAWSNSEADELKDVDNPIRLNLKQMLNRFRSRNPNRTSEAKPIPKRKDKYVSKDTVNTSNTSQGLWMD
jgi:hypothetical protein